MLKFVKKIQLQGVRNAIEKREDFMNTKWIDALEYKDVDRLTVCMIIKNFTNYNNIKDNGFWAQSKNEVQQQLCKCYSQIIKLDDTLKDACIYGMKRHLENYMAYHIIAKKDLLKK